MDGEEGSTWVWVTPTTIPLEEAMGEEDTMVYPPPAPAGGVDPLEAVLSRLTFPREDGKTSKEVLREILGGLPSWPSSEEVPPSDFPLPPMESESELEGLIQP